MAQGEGSRGLQSVFWNDGVMKAGGTAQGPQEAAHPEGKSKLSVFAAAWSQTLKCTRERKDAGKPSRNIQCLLGSQTKCNRNVTCSATRGD